MAWRLQWQGRGPRKAAAVAAAAGMGKRGGGTKKPAPQSPPPPEPAPEAKAGRCCTPSPLLLTSLSLNLVALCFFFNPWAFGPASPFRSTHRDLATAVARQIPPVPPPLDSVIHLAHGDPTMFEPYWRLVGDRAAVTIPGSFRVSYFSNMSSLCWFLEPPFADAVRHLHRLVGNAVADDGRHIVVGTGSSQLIQAALYALSPPNTASPIAVVSESPYYSSYPAITDMLRSGLYRWGGDARAFKGSSYIELVCYPNNPDGSIREAVLKSECGRTIHDLAYYWPQYTSITQAADHDVMLFSLSKCTGHAGMRLGWALVKNKEVARKMVQFIELSTIGVSKDSQLRAAKVLKVISDSYESPQAVWANMRFFEFGRRLLELRWKRLREAVAMSGAFSLPDQHLGFCNFTQSHTVTVPAFAWLRCEKEEASDCERFLGSLKIRTRGGQYFGADQKYTRISMIDRDMNFDLFVERLTTLTL